MISDNHKQQFEETGYVIINGIIPDDQLEPLRQACDRVVVKARNGQWPHRRMVGVQFPPYLNVGDDLWGVQHMMHPDLNEPIFAQWYGSEKLMDAIKELLDVKDDKFLIELFNMLVNPVLGNYSLMWHRDDIRPTVSDDEEFRCLNLPRHGIQWNTALYPDDCLQVVPGTHKRIRTPEQRQIQLEDPFTDHMPGAITVHLDVGQTLFYDHAILHRGVYDKNYKRATLHASMGIQSGGEHRARSLFEQELDWMRGDKFRNTLPKNLHAYLDNLNALAEESKDKNLGYGMT